MFPHHLRQKSPEPPADPRPSGGIGRTLVSVLGAIVLGLAVVSGAVVLGPGVPEEWNPFSPLDPQAAPGPLTAWKLDRATRTPEACRAALERAPGLVHVAMPDRRVSEVCAIEGHTLLRGLAGAALAPADVATSCTIALRLHMWERHALQPAARAHLGARVSDVGHLSSFACRPIRTEAGEGEEMSDHARALAIDIDAVRLTNGRVLELRDSWQSPDPAVRAFWREARDGACGLFRTVLGPDFNSLHADHFHLGQGRYAACR